MPLIRLESKLWFESSSRLTPILCVMRAAKALASLKMCTDLLEPSMLDNAISFKNLVCWLICIRTIAE